MVLTPERAAPLLFRGAPPPHCAVETIAQTLTSDASQDMELQSAMCFLLTGLVAFCEATHQRVMALGLVPQLVALCRTRTSVSYAVGG